MTHCLVTADGAAEDPIDWDALAHRLSVGELFWLDLHRPSPEDLDRLRELIQPHPLALEDTAKFNQRPKIDQYDDHALLVLYGWAPDEDGLVEVHCYYGASYLVTVHRDDSPALQGLRRTYAAGRLRVTGSLDLLYRVTDALVDSFFAPLGNFDERLDLIQDEMLSRPKNEHLRDIFTMKRRLVRLRRVIVPQRDLVGRLVAGTEEVAGWTPEAERYFRDIYDHLLRLGETVDAYRDLMTASIDLYMSSGSNRMSNVMKQLTVIATIFLPLTFVTGFFGQNFPWMVSHIGGWTWFVGLGIGLQLLTVALLVGWFKRRGWW